MATAIRFARMGKKKRPFYRLVAVDSRKRRDGAYLANLGFYNPFVEPYELQLHDDEIIAWMKRGAVVSETARNLLKGQGLLLRFALEKQGVEAEEVARRVAEYRADAGAASRSAPRPIARRKAEAVAAAAKAKAEAEAEKAAAAKARPTRRRPRRRRGGGGGRGGRGRSATRRPTRRRPRPSGGRRELSGMADYQGLLAMLVVNLVDHPPTCAHPAPRTAGARGVPADRPPGRPGQADRQGRPDGARAARAADRRGGARRRARRLRDRRVGAHGRRATAAASGFVPVAEVVKAVGLRGQYKLYPLLDWHPPLLETGPCAGGTGRRSGRDGAADGAAW